MNPAEKVQTFGDKITFRRSSQIKVCLQVITRQDSDKTPGINVDMCKNDNENSWQGKETFQLTINEISYFTAYWLKYVEDVNFAYHGEKHNRSLTVKRKSKKPMASGGKKSTGKETPYHQISLWEAGEGLHFINIDDAEGFGVFNLLLSTLSKHYKMNNGECIELLKAYYQ
jgi:hypothetical protein